MDSAPDSLSMGRQLNPFRVIGGVRKGICPQLLLCSIDKAVITTVQKKDFKGLEIFS